MNAQNTSQDIGTNGNTCKRGKLKSLAKKRLQHVEEMNDQAFKHHTQELNRLKKCRERDRIHREKLRSSSCAKTVQRISSKETVKTTATAPF
mmetsp:Transcript_9465/g.12307  ORF Transcript_9465/g.12307 Transcript_9465/m.12307 type:complete len:92 (+) Transcript_9465:42-317(+)